MQILELVITSIVSGVVGAIVGIFFGMCRRELSYLRPMHKLLRDLASDSQNLNIFIGVFSIPQFSVVREKFTDVKVLELTNITEITSKESAESLSYVLSLLREVRSYRNLGVVNSEELRESDLNANIICIGGPATNKVTKRIIDSEEIWIPYKYLKEEEKIERIIGKKEEWTANEETDYGVIIKTENSCSPNKWIFILFGISGFGSVGACYFLWSRFKNLVDQFGNGPFGVLVKVNKKIGYASAAQVDSVIPAKQ